MAAALAAATVLFAAASPSHAAPASARADAERAARVIAETAPAVPQLRRGGGVTAQAIPVQGYQWRVRFAVRGKPRAEVVVDIARRQRLAVWTGAALDYPMARGYRGWFAGHVNALWVWLPLTVLFIAPFFDPRRPFRALHLDLLAVASLGVSLAFFNDGRIAASTALIYPPLLYLFARALLLAYRRGAARPRLVPLAGTRALTLLLVALMAGRIAFNLVDTGQRDYIGYGKVESSVIDVGLAGVIGADRIEHGEQLYTAGGSKLDTYGPANYLAYVPFELISPYRGSWDFLPAAHAAAIAFDLATVAGLMLLGFRLRPGRQGRELGVALGYAWAACPFTLYVLASNTNDGLVAALLVALLLALRSPPLRGTMLALAAATKFAPVALLPLVARGTRPTRRAVLIAVGAFAAVSLVLFVPFIPDGGPRELYDATVGYQLGEHSPFTVWGRHPGLDPLHTLASAAVVALALALAWRPGKTDLAGFAARAAAVVIAVQLVAMHWIYFYVVWFLPLLLVAAFAGEPTAKPPAPSSQPR